MNNSWYEVWADEGMSVPYLLLLRPTGEAFEVLDPALGNKRVFHCPDYAAARLWLLEDEYVLVGRKALDD